MTQAEFDFERLERDGIARRRRTRLLEGIDWDSIDVPDDWQTTTRKMAAVLEILSDAIGQKEAFRMKVETIAGKQGCHRKTTQRALNALRQLGLVDRSRTGRASIYSVSWRAVQALSATTISVPSDGTYVPTDAAYVPSDGTYVPSTIPSPYHHSTNLLPGKPAAAEVVEGWEKATAALEAAGLDQVGDTIQRAQREGRSPAELMEASAVYQANRDKLTSPGAIRYWLRTGDWPAGDLRTPAAAAAAQAERDQRKAAENARTLYERERFRFHRSGREELATLQAAHGAAIDHHGRFDELAGALANPFTASAVRDDPADDFHRYLLLVEYHRQQCRRAD